MNQVQIDVVQPEVLQRGTACTLDQIRPVERVPQLAGNEQVLALYDSLVDFGLHAFAHLVLVLVHVGTVDMAVADIDRILHRLGDLTRRRTPSSQAEHGHLLPVVERHKGNGRSHD